MPLLEDRGPSQVIRPLTLGGTWNSAWTARVGHPSEGAPERRLLMSLRSALLFLQGKSESESERFALPNKALRLQFVGQRGQLGPLTQQFSLLLGKLIDLRPQITGVRVVARLALNGFVRIDLLLPCR